MKQFPLVVFDAPKVMQLLYSCAYARAAAADARIIDEPAIFNPQIYLPKRVGGVNEKNPQEFQNGVMKIYKRYQDGFAQALSTGSAVHYLESCVKVRDASRAQIMAMHEYVNKHNADSDNSLSTAYHTVVAVRAVCTVALATGAVVLGTPGALVFTGYKVVSGFATSTDTSQHATYKTGFGLAIGKVENGVISVGDLAQEILNKGIFEGIGYVASGFLQRMRDDFARNRQLILNLQSQIAQDAEELVKKMNRFDIKKAARARLGNQIVVARAELAAAQSQSSRLAAQRVAGSSVARTAIRGIPIVFLANDVISAYNEWYDAENAWGNRP